MKLEHFESCIIDVDTIGYDIYDAVEDFEAGDFDSVLDGVARLGDAIEAIADGISECKDAVEIDWKTLMEMGEIFKHPEDLIVQIGEDILLNRKSIKSDIDAFKADFAAESWEQAGKDIGDAVALVFFGKVRGVSGESSTKSDNQYNAYQTLAGYAVIH